MGFWEDILNAINGFFEWLSGIGGSVTEPLSTLGSWIYGGFVAVGSYIYQGAISFAEWIYNGLKWLADTISEKFYESYKYLSEWISSGLSWIGSGISVIGQHIYSFGQWIWNSIYWIGQTVWNLILSLINWIIDTIKNAWNQIVSFSSNFINSLNQHINNWIKSFRSKFIQLFTVNTTIALLRRSLDNFITNPNPKSLIGVLASPFLSIFSANILDALIPKPASQEVKIYIPFQLPFWDYTPFSFQIPAIPEYPAPPEAIPPPVTPPYPQPETVKNITESISSQYETFIQVPYSATITNDIKSEHEEVLQEQIVINVIDTNIITLETESSPYGIEAIEVISGTISTEYESSLQLPETYSLKITINV